MPVADVLEKIGSDVAKGAKVAGSVALPIAERTAQVVSGEAPQIDEEKRQQQYKMEDAAIASKAQQLESQLETGRKYGTLTPEQQQQYVDQISQLYSHPRHAGTLMEKLRQAVHPNGAVATQGLQTLKDATPQGGTANADEERAERLAQTKLMGQPKIAAMENYSQEHFGTPFASGTSEQQLEAMKAVAAGSTNKNAHLLINGSITNGGVDEQGKTWTPDQMVSGEAGPTLKGLYESQQKGAETKRQQALDKLKETQDFQRQQLGKRETFQAGQNSLNRQNQREMAGVHSLETEYTKLDEAARANEEQVQALNDVYALPGDKSAADNALIATYARVLSRGTRIPMAELQLTRQIGSMGLRFDQMVQKAATGELPPELRKILMDMTVAEATEGRKQANDVLNGSVPMAGGGQSNIPGASVPKPKPGGVARALAPVTPPGGAAKPKPPSAVGTVNYQGKTYWVDKDKNNLGEK